MRYAIANCVLDTVHDLVVPGGHSAPDKVSDQWLPWIGDLFAATPFKSSCPQ
ncbi:hypothetical protein [Nocardia sp. NPDC006630]|uniref:hypothetical protein n=1 Tax=Nocardia sp. NPDC006630 TaxID=3157181 RepID=UPI0033BA4836